MAQTEQKAKTVNALESLFAIGRSDAWDGAPMSFHQLQHYPNTPENRKAYEDGYKSVTPAT